MANGNTSSHRSPARWNIVSVAMPLVGFIAGAVAGTIGPDMMNQHPMEGIAWGFRTWFGFCAVGMIAAILATVRRERLRALTLIGFLLNLPLFFLSSLFLGGR